MMHFRKFSIISVLLLMLIVPSFAVAAFASSQSNSRLTNASGAPVGTCNTVLGSIYYYFQGFVFNPLNKLTYVYYPLEILVLKGTYTVVTTIHFPGATIRSAAFNPMNGLLYVFLNSNSTIVLYKGTSFYGRMDTISYPGIQISYYLS